MSVLTFDHTSAQRLVALFRFFHRTVECCTERNIAPVNSADATGAAWCTSRASVTPSVEPDITAAKGAMPLIARVEDRAQGQIDLEGGRLPSERGQRLDTRERRVILRGCTYARYVHTGQLVYARAGTLMAVGFDRERLETTGDPTPVAQRVSLTTEGAAQFDVSRPGSLVYVSGDLQGTGRSLVWVDREGREQPL